MGTVSKLGDRQVGKRASLQRCLFLASSARTHHVQPKTLPLTISLTLLMQIYSTAALAASNGDLKGRVLRSRNAEPISNADVRIDEKIANTTSDAHGAFEIEDLPPGTYRVIVTPPSGSSIQHKVTIVAGKTTHDDFIVGPEMSALDQITVLAQRTPIQIARAAQMEAPNLVNITTYEEIRKIPDVSVAEAVRRVPGISLETDEGEGRYVNCRGLDADLNSTTFGGLSAPSDQQRLAVRRLSRGDARFNSNRPGRRLDRDEIQSPESGRGSFGLHARDHA